MARNLGGRGQGRGLEGRHEVPERRGVLEPLLCDRRRQLPLRHVALVPLERLVELVSEPRGELEILSPRRSLHRRPKPVLQVGLVLGLAPAPVGVGLVVGRLGDG